MNERRLDPQLAELAERCRSAGFVMMPAEPSNEIIDVLARSVFQVPGGRWDIAKKDAVDAYGSIVAVGQL